ncbi:glycosyltransferase family 4 protein [Bacillus solimangrovi]|uniref:Glycosyl transferase n=1 Tax=Bacillus solimangrovi TaxID=1305675 RepID=A0A1E5LG45_9BACI|nr:glycosyltransferase family 4 protein [Bacillus solimangrovi]OEH93044.1 glycosyl transferase [Bacillus solimangrovi]
MNIAFVCTEKLPCPSVKGGAIQIMIDGITPMLKQRFSITIYSIEDASLPTSNQEDGVQYIRFPKEAYYENVANHIGEESYDLIHVFNRPKVVPLIHEASQNSCIVLSIHNDMFSQIKMSSEEAREAIRIATKITTVSEYIKRAIIERYPEALEKTQVLYSGVDFEKYPSRWSNKGTQIRSEKRSELMIDDKKVILFIGRLSKTKGPDVLIKAMKHVIEEHDDAVLVIVGGKWFSDDGMNDYVRVLYELAEPIKENVMFTSYIASEEIPSVWLAGDVFVCSSQWHEPLARVHYEAMAAGIPIITTNRGGNAEVMIDGFNGFVIDDYDEPNSYASCLNPLLHDPHLCEEVGRNGRTFAMLNYRFTHTANRLGAIYEEALCVRNQ